MSNMNKGCTAKAWKLEATKEAESAGLDPVKVLAGYRPVPYVEARWRAWRTLWARGYSFNSIGAASGFDHTTVRNGCLKPEYEPVSAFDFVFHQPTECTGVYPSSVSEVA